MIRTKERYRYLEFYRVQHQTPLNWSAIDTATPGPKHPSEKVPTPTGREPRESGLPPNHPVH